MNFIEPSTPIVLSDEAIAHLSSTRKWTFFLAIIGFITAALMILLGVFLSFMIRIMPMGEEVSKIPGGIMSILYIFFGMVYILPAIFLLNYSNKLKRSLETHDGQVLSEAFKFLRFHFTFFGIFTIVMIAFTILGVFVAILMAMMSSMNGAV